MAHDDDELTDADRRAIAAIRRELDAEFGPLEAAIPRDAPDAPDAEAPDSAIDELDVPTSSPRPGVVAAFVAGVLIGALVGGVGTFVLLRPARDDGASAKAAPSASVGLTATSLREALDEWLDATERGDIPGQMRFYPSRVPVYYTWRDVPRDAVRAEKVKVLGEATRLLIATDAPTLDVADDGASAVTHFRKRYVIEGPAVRRHGEVLQELRWKRTADGWLIVSERDARVLASD